MQHHLVPFFQEENHFQPFGEPFFENDSFFRGGAPPKHGYEEKNRSPLHVQICYIGEGKFLFYVIM